jgi:DNA ligase (NAD+)
MADKSARNLLAGIEASKTRPLVRLLYGLGIRHVGIHAARLLVQAFGSLERLRTEAEAAVAAVPGVGPVVAESVAHFFADEENRQLITRLAAHGLEMEQKRAAGPRPLAGRKFVITGTLSTMSREEATELLLSLGAAVGSSVSKKTDCVVVGESPGSKYDKATQLGVKTIGEDEFLALVGRRS